jgi:hypothetical protein
MSSLSEYLRAKWADPQWAAVRRRQLADAHCPGIPTPKWVPDELRDEYRDFARLYGEERAAKEIRMMKAEARG